MKQFILTTIYLFLFSNLILSQSGTLVINQPPTPTEVEVGQSITVNVTYSASEEMDIEATIYQLDGNGQINWGAGHGGTWTRPTFPASAGSTVNININIPSNFDPNLDYVFVFQLKTATGTIAGDYDNPIDIIPSATVLNEMEDPIINYTSTYTAGSNLDFTVDYTADQEMFFKVQLLIKNMVNNGVNYKHYGYYQQDFPSAAEMTTANISLPIVNSARGSDELHSDSAYVVLVELWKKDVVAKTNGISRAPERVRFYFSDPLTIEAATAVPVKLLSFTGEKLDDNSVVLEWQTALEINNDYFSVEQSNDAINWKSTARILGNGNANTINNYSYVDRTPIQGNNFYRLMQVDFDGSKTFSDVINVNIERVKIEIYPNPISEMAVITLPYKNFKASKYNLFDMGGKLLMHGVLKSDVSNVDLRKLNSGSYIINIIHNHSVIHTQKLIKKKVD